MGLFKARILFSQNNMVDACKLIDELYAEIKVCNNFDKDSAQKTDISNTVEIYFTNVTMAIVINNYVLCQAIYSGVSLSTLESYISLLQFAQEKIAQCHKPPIYVLEGINSHLTTAKQWSLTKKYSVAFIW